MTVSRNRKKATPRSDAQKHVPQSASLSERFGRASSALADNRFLTWIFITLFGVLSLLNFPTWEGGDYDMWWHFALGRHYVSQHTMQVNHAIFSWTPADPGWLYNTWLGSTIAYLFYVTAGGFGLWVFQWIIFAGIFLFFLSFVRSTQGSLDMNALALLLIVIIVEGLALVFPKPELFTPLFFAALLAVFFSIKRHRLSPRYFYLYPVMFVFWVNLHGGFIIGVGMAVILFVTEWLNYALVRRESLSASGLVHLGCSVVLICVACLVNPHGWAYPWETITVNFPLFMQTAGDSSSLASSLIAYGSLWPHLLHSGKLNWWAAGWGMIVLLCLFLVVSWTAFRKKGVVDISLLFLNPFLFYYGMNTVRACIFFPTVALFSIFYTVEKAEMLSTIKRYTLLSLFLYLCLGSVVLIKLTETSAFNFFGMNLEDTVPVKEVELIKKHRLPPPLFNDYLSGGYMIWALYPEYKVFIDSRGGAYLSGQVWDYYNRFMVNPNRETIRKVTARYPFRVALINLAHTETILDLLDNAGDEWRLLFLGRNAAILVHASVLPSLSGDLLRSINSDPAQFRDVKNPETLAKLFLIYVRWASEYGSVIRDIFAQNVSNYYRYKERQLAVMTEIVAEKKAMEAASGALQRR